MNVISLIDFCPIQDYCLKLPINFSGFMVLLLTSENHCQSNLIMRLRWRLLSARQYIDIMIKMKQILGKHGLSVCFSFIFEQKTSSNLQYLYFLWKSRKKMSNVKCVIYFHFYFEVNKINLTKRHFLCGCEGILKAFFHEFFV